MIEVFFTLACSVPGGDNDTRNAQVVCSPKIPVLTLSRRSVSSSGQGTPVADNWEPVMHRIVYHYFHHQVLKTVADEGLCNWEIRLNEPLTYS